MNEAGKRLDDALLLVREAAQNYVERYGNDLRGLMKIIDQSSGQWSGGPYTRINIIEALIKEKAMQELDRQIRRLPVSK
jgi:hypothetical protein